MNLLEEIRKQELTIQTGHIPHDDNKPGTGPLQQGQPVAHLTLTHPPVLTFNTTEEPDVNTPQTRWLVAIALAHLASHKHLVHEITLRGTDIKPKPPSWMKLAGAAAAQAAATLLPAPALLTLIGRPQPHEPKTPRQTLIETVAKTFATPQDVVEHRLIALGHIPKHAAG